MGGLNRYSQRAMSRMGIDGSKLPGGSHQARLGLDEDRVNAGIELVR